MLWGINLIYLLACILLVLTAINIVFTPAMFGEDRKPYSFKDWLVGLPFAAMNVVVYLRVLGII